MRESTIRSLISSNLSASVGEDTPGTQSRKQAAENEKKKTWRTPSGALPCFVSPTSPPYPPPKNATTNIQNETWPREEDTYLSTVYRSHMLKKDLYNPCFPKTALKVKINKTKKHRGSIDTRGADPARCPLGLSSECSDNPKIT